MGRKVSDDWQGGMESVRVLARRRTSYTAIGWKTERRESRRGKEDASALSWAWEFNNKNSWWHVFHFNIFHSWAGAAADAITSGTSNDHVVHSFHLSLFAYLRQKYSIDKFVQNSNYLYNAGKSYSPVYFSCFSSVIPFRITTDEVCSHVEFN